MYLPDEILCLITLYLDNQHDRYNLILVCRRFHRILLPTLYTDVTLDRGLDAKQACSFFQAIFRAPRLAQAVRSLHIHPWKTPSCVLIDGSDSELELDYDEALVETVLEDLKLPSEERKAWDGCITTGVTDAWLALVLLRLRNLQKIFIYWPYGATYVPRILERVAAAAALESNAIFPHLKEAYATWYDTEGGVDSTLMNPFFAFPSMNKICGFKVVEDDERQHTEPSYSYSGITEIDLVLSNAHDGMADWIRRCKELKSFRIIHGGSMISHHSFIASAFLRSLALHRSTLERLWLDYGDDTEYDNEEWAGSFTEFTALKQLYLRLPNLLDVDDEEEPTREFKDVLPRSIESLYLCDCWFEFTESIVLQLEDLVSSRCMSKLTRLDLQGDFDKDVSMGRLEAVCAEAGVSFKCWTTGERDIEEHLASIWPSDDFHAIH